VLPHSSHPQTQWRISDSPTFNATSIRHTTYSRSYTQLCMLNLGLCEERNLWKKPMRGSNNWNIPRFPGGRIPQPQLHHHKKNSQVQRLVAAKGATTANPTLQRKELAELPVILHTKQPTFIQVSCSQSTPLHISSSALECTVRARVSMD
jgi:hypothetical protein